MRLPISSSSPQIQPESTPEVEAIQTTSRPKKSTSKRSSKSKSKSTTSGEESSGVYGSSPSETFANVHHSYPQYHQYSAMIGSVESSGQTTSSSSSSSSSSCDPFYSTYPAVGVNVPSSSYPSSYHQSFSGQPNNEYNYYLNYHHSHHPHDYMTTQPTLPPVSMNGSGYFVANDYLMSQLGSNNNKNVESSLSNVAAVVVAPN